ncbi:MAG: ADP-ribosylglycohydrolase family protein [Spirochaetia bacterium]|nr:ADP-ribosylglycohydrolase family protein [Spirochaetia bacterium]
MYGAILGDIVGSPYEFEPINTTDFPLLSDDSMFTDDSVMTIAVADVLLGAGKNPDEKAVKMALIKSFKKWGAKYPFAGYGGQFHHWLFSDMTEPYYSFGNGSAMRVSAAGWLYDTMEMTRKAARWTAEITHNHPFGIDGAEATAAAIFMARNGKSKQEIKDYIKEEFGYNLDRTCDQIRPDYGFDESCQGTVPEAIVAFLDSKDYEDAIRLAVSLGGDADTLACITGGIAEAYYGMSPKLIQACRDSLMPDMLAVLDRFDKVKFDILIKDSLNEMRDAQYKG